MYGVLVKIGEDLAYEVYVDADKFMIANPLSDMPMYQFFKEGERIGSFPVMGEAGGAIGVWELEDKAEPQESPGGEDGLVAEGPGGASMGEVE